MSIALKSKLVLLIIVLIGAFLRFTGINWDQGAHLHPDERFLTMVGIELKLPTSFREYLSPARSLLNPGNILDYSGNKKYSFFVYGTLPLTLNKVAAVLTDADDYAGFTLTGRFLSAFIDLLAIIFLFKSVKLLEEKYNLDSSIKYLASFFYALAVTPIQLSHFFTVDTFLNTFLLASWYFSVNYYIRRKNYQLILSALFMGFALGTKIAGVFMLPLILVLIAGSHLSPPVINLAKYTKLLLFKEKTVLFKVIITVLIFGLTAYLSLRIADPYMFEHENPANPEISSNLINNFKTLKSWEGKDVWFPPAVQWIPTAPVIFALYNLVFYGLGLVLSIFVITGIITQSFNTKRFIIFSTAIWVSLFFLYQSTQFTKNGRYFLILYPYLAFLAALGYYTVFNKSHYVIKVITLLLTAVWPMAFISIYLQPHSRVNATSWIHGNLPSGSTIAWELWDDPLPLYQPVSNNKSFNYLELPVFDPDSDEKWQRISAMLSEADYYILSSNRAWGSIPKVPEKYPVTSKFYNDLLSGRKGFLKIKEFTSYPSLRYLGIPLTFPDDDSEESFTVYDHPKVIILKNVNSRN